MPEIKLYKSKWKAIRLILLSLPFVIAALYFIITDDHDKMMSWICLCFFGLGIPLGIFNLCDHRPQVVISEVGIFLKMGYNVLINWNLIKDAYPKDVVITTRYGIKSKQPFICLVLDDDVTEHLKGSKFLKQLNKDLGFQVVNIALSQLKTIDKERFTKFLKAMASADASGRQGLLKNMNDLNSL